MNIRPLHDRIVVKRLEEDDSKIGALFVPDSAKEKPQKGEVVAVGKGKHADDGKLIPLDVQAGSHSVWQIFRLGHQARRHRIPHHARRRSSRGARGRR